MLGFTRPVSTNKGLIDIKIRPGVKSATMIHNPKQKGLRADQKRSSKYEIIQKSGGGSTTLSTNKSGKNVGKIKKIISVERL